MKLAITGHRTKGIIDDKVKLDKLLQKTFLEVEPDVILVGMSEGFDLLAGIAGIKTCYPVWSIIPWAGHQQSDYIKGFEQDYEFVKHFSQKVIVLDESEEYPGPQAFHKRNKYLIDNCDRVLAYSSGEKSGTRSTLNYGLSRGIKYRNLYGKAMGE